MEHLAVGRLHTRFRDRLRGPYLAAGVMTEDELVAVLIVVMLYMVVFGDYLAHL
jgi:hypothetical protein